MVRNATEAVKNGDSVTSVGELDRLSKKPRKRKDLILEISFRKAEATMEEWKTDPPSVHGVAWKPVSGSGDDEEDPDKVLDPGFEFRDGPWRRAAPLERTALQGGEFIVEAEPRDEWVDWDGNGLAFRERGPVSDQFQISF